MLFLLFCFWISAALTHKCYSFMPTPSAWFLTMFKALKIFSEHFLGHVSISVIASYRCFFKISLTTG